MAARLVPILLPSLVALSISLWGIQSRQVWRDEHATWWAATLPLDALLRLVSHIDAVIAPYYLAMRPWIALAGGSPLSLRLPSALAVGLCAGALALLGKRLFEARVGLVAGLLLAVVPKLTRYGQEARPYAFTLLFTVVSVLCLLRALREPRAGRFAAYAASIFLLGCMHLVALCSLAGHPFLLFVRPEGAPRLARRTLLGFGLAVVAGLALVAPLAYVGTQQIAQIAWTAKMSHGALDAPGLLFGAPRLGRPIMLLGLCALWRPRRERLFVAAWAILPLAFLLVTRDTLHLFIHRYLLFALPAWCLLAAISVNDLGELLERLTRRRWTGHVLVALLVALAARRSLHKQLELRAELPPGRAFDYGSVGAQLRAHARGGDAVAFDGASDAAQWARMAMRYELRDRPPLRDVFVRASAAQIGQLYAETCEPEAPCLPPDVRRLWLVSCVDGDSRQRPGYAGMAELLAREFAVKQTESFHNIELSLLERRAGLASSAR